MRQKQESKRGELSKQELAEIQPHIIRRPELKKWDVTIVPEPVNY